MLLTSEMKLSVLIVAWSILTVGYEAEAAKILAIFPMPATSHYILGHEFLMGLAERGHDVTMISPYQNKVSPKNGTYRDVFLTGFYEAVEKRKKEINMFETPGTNAFFMIGFINYMMIETTEAALEHENVQKLLHSGEKFDAVIVEQFMTDAHKAFATHFGAPLIVFSTTGLTSWVDHLVRNPTPLSYVPEIMADPEGDRMTFWERAKNVLVHWFFIAFNELYVYPTHNGIIKRHMPNPPVLNDILYNASLVLLNGHISLNPATPRVPSMIDIGGFHIKPPGKLPKDLQEFLDNSPEGVVYFSMGSNLQSTQMRPEKRDAFLKAFAKLKQKVLWKWEDDTLPGQPPNLKLGKWLPQKDILAHPNIKLFVTHGGFLSTAETIYHGVPVLAIPIFGDQKANAKMAVEGGFGRTLSYAEVTEEALTENLQELLTNPKYAENAKTKSRLFHDRPMTAMDTGAYWVEYVIRHKGAPHLRVAGLELPWYQYYLLDVAALFIAVGLVLLYFNYRITRAVLRIICRRFGSSCSRKKKDKMKEKKSQ